MVRGGFGMADGSLYYQLPLTQEDIGKRVLKIGFVVRFGKAKEFGPSL